MRQISRTLTTVDEGTLVGYLVLICDRDQKWSAPIRRTLSESQIRIVQTPFQAPNCNAHAERFVRSIKGECLDRMIPLGERHLRRALHEFVAHYHRARNLREAVELAVHTVRPERVFLTRTSIVIASPAKLNAAFSYSGVEKSSRAV